MGSLLIIILLGVEKIMVKNSLTTIALAAMMIFVSGVALADGDAKEGEKVYKKCRVCHSVKVGEHKIGPSLAGVFGQKAGTAKGFTKFKALKGANWKWDGENLDGWVANQKKFLEAKGIKKRTGMRIKIKSEEDRRNLIAYLRTL